MMNLSDLSDEDSPENGPLQFSDVEPYLQKPIDAGDEKMQRFINNLRINGAKNRVKRVNANYSKLQYVWPDGDGIDYFVAFEMFSNLSDKEIRNELMNQENVRKVLEEVENRKKGNPSVKQIVVPSNFYSLYPDDDNVDDDNESESDYDYDTTNDGEENLIMSLEQKRKYVHWTDEDLDKFIHLMQTQSKKMTWTTVAKQFRDRTAEQCHNLYYRLRREKRLNETFIAKRELKEKKTNYVKGKKEKLPAKLTISDEEIKMMDHIKALIFCCGSQKAIVGPFTRKMKDYACRNPLFQCTDTITEQPLFIPAISPYGTVFDYETWMRIMDDDQIDPNIRLKINSKSDIKILTDENFEKYKGMIRNLTEIGYKEPAPQPPDDV